MQGVQVQSLVGHLSPYAATREPLHTSMKAQRSQIKRTQDFHYPHVPIPLLQPLVFFLSLCSLSYPRRQTWWDSQFWTWLCHHMTLGKALALVDSGKWKGLDGSWSLLAVPTACELYVLWVLFPSIHWGRQLFLYPQMTMMGKKKWPAEEGWRDHGESSVGIDTRYQSRSHVNKYPKQRKAATSNCSPLYGQQLQASLCFTPEGKDHSLWLLAIRALSAPFGCSPRCNTGWVPPTTGHRFSS